MRRFLSGALALALSAALCLPAQAAAGAEIIRAFVYDGTLYTYMSIDGTDRPITKAEVKIRNQTFSAGCRLETVRQAGAPVTWLLLVDNSDSMPAFREDVENFAESLAQSGGEDSRFILASFGDAFAVANEDVPAEELAEAVEGLPLDERVTRLHTAIDQAVSYFESVPREGNELRCLVVLSDGVQYDPSGGMPYEELLERVEQSDVMLHSIGLGDDAQSLESMGKLAAASGGVHQVLGEELSPKDAGTALTEASGELFITGFDLSGGTFSGGVETAAVTLASGGELLCRAETEVELPARDSAETAPPAQAPSLPDSQADASGGTVLPEAGAPEDGGWPVLPILGAAAALSAAGEKKTACRACLPASGGGARGGDRCSCRNLHALGSSSRRDEGGACGPGTAGGAGDWQRSGLRHPAAGGGRIPPACQGILFRRLGMAGRPWFAEWNIYQRHGNCPAGSTAQRRSDHCGRYGFSIEILADGQETGGLDIRAFSCGGLWGGPASAGCFLGSGIFDR